MAKELAGFKKICKNLNSYEFTDEYKKNKKLIETALKKQKQDENKLKALNIIIEKDVNVYWLRYVLKRHKEVEPRPLYSSAFEAYNNGVKVERRLTQEEFNSVKQVVCREEENQGTKQRRS